MLPVENLQIVLAVENPHALLDGLKASTKRYWAINNKYMLDIQKLFTVDYVPTVYQLK